MENKKNILIEKLENDLASHQLEIEQIGKMLSEIQQKLNENPTDHDALFMQNNLKIELDKAIADKKAIEFNLNLSKLGRKHIWQ